jgi:hypothetical protein
MPDMTRKTALVGLRSEDVRRGLVRAAAVSLALASAWVLAGLARVEESRPPQLWLFLRALAVTAPLQTGLFWSATARGWQRLFAALLMVPSALLLGGLIGETVGRVARGYPLKALATTTWIAGAIVYAWQFYALTRPRKGAQ